MKRNVLSSPRLLQLKKRKWKVLLIKVLLFLFFISAVFVGLSYLSRIPRLNIKEIKITGNRIADALMLEKTVETQISGNYLWFFPKTNFFFYPKNKIKKELHEKYKELKDISLSIEDKTTLKISITERQAVYTWCGNTLEKNEVVDQKCYFMDEEGYIFSKAPRFSGNTYFKFYGPSDAESYLSEENLKRLIYFKDTLETMELKPASLYASGNGDIKIFLFNSNKIAPEPYIIFKIDSDLENVAENLQTALSTEPLKSNFKNKYSSLEYIDLRFGNKVYYKFR